MQLTEVILEKFWQRVQKRSDEECWPWTGSVDRQGRGKFWVAGTGKHFSAPRVALIGLTGENPPSSLFACHTCDNPACCNPAHLWWGTRSDNMKDCGSKGRHGFQLKYRGESNPQSKLTDEDVRAIRRRYNDGERPGIIGADYGILQQSIWKIATRRSWKHVD